MLTPSPNGARWPEPQASREPRTVQISNSPNWPWDNNTSERALRGPVVGRKNYYGSGSVVSAQLASRVFTITATATRAGLNPLSYLRADPDERAGGRGAPPPPVRR